MKWNVCYYCEQTILTIKIYFQKKIKKIFCRNEQIEVHPSIHPSIHQSIHQSINQSTIACHLLTFTLASSTVSKKHSSLFGSILIVMPCTCDVTKQKNIRVATRSTHPVGRCFASILLLFSDFLLCFLLLLVCLCMCGDVLCGWFWSETRSMRKTTAQHTQKVRRIFLKKCNFSDWELQWFRLLQYWTLGTCLALSIGTSGSQLCNKCILLFTTEAAQEAPPPLHCNADGSPRLLLRPLLLLLLHHLNPITIKKRKKNHSKCFEIAADKSNMTSCRRRKMSSSPSCSEFNVQWHATWSLESCSLHYSCGRSFMSCIPSLTPTWTSRRSLKKRKRKRGDELQESG